MITKEKLFITPVCFKQLSTVSLQPDIANFVGVSVRFVAESKACDHSALL